MQEHLTIKYLRIAEVVAKTGLSRTTIYRLLKGGKFPRSCRPGGVGLVWEGRAVDAWMAESERKRRNTIPGYEQGYEDGLKRGQEVARADRMSSRGELESEMIDVSARLLLLANALRYPANDPSIRTDTWWAAYVSSAAKELHALARSMPGLCGAIIEFEKDIPHGN